MTDQAEPAEQPEQPEQPDQGTPESGSATVTVGAGRTVQFAPLPVLGGTRLRVALSGNGNADLLVGVNGAPSLTSFACFAGGAGSTHVCEGTLSATAEQVFIAVVGRTRSTVTVTANWVEPSN
jgi:hypothetical protein